MDDMETEEDTKCRTNSKTFTLNTNTTCFLCLNNTFSDSSNQFSNESFPNLENGENPLKQQKIISLLSICRYLRLNCKEILANNLMYKHPNFSVALCTKCSNITTNLIVLCQELEVLQMKVDHCLQSFLDELEKSELDLNRIQNIQQLQAKQLENIQVNTLRKKIKKNCEIKLESKLPKVIITQRKEIEIAPKIISTESLLPPQAPPISLQETPKEDPISAPKSAESPTTATCIYKCRFCNKAFSQKDLLPAHIKSTHPPPVFGPVSNIIPTILKSRCRTPPVISKEHTIWTHVDTLMTDYKLPQTSPDKFKVHCNHIFKIETSKKGINSTEKTISYYCSHCTAFYKKQGMLRFHLYNCHKDILGQKIVEAQKCRTVDRLKSIKLPLKKPRKENPGPPPEKQFHTCKICDPICKYDDKYGYKKHQIRMHFDYLMCEHKMENISPDDFKLYSNHILKVESIMAKRGTDDKGKFICFCPHCPQTYAGPEFLKLHLFYKHKDILANKLVELQKSTSVEELKAVKLPGLTSVPKVKCSECGLSFGGRCNLWTHKQYQCKFGPKLNPEDATKSGGFQCPDCQRKFNFEKHLRMHQRKCFFKSQKTSASEPKEVVTVTSMENCEETPGVFIKMETVLDHDDGQLQNLGFEDETEPDDDNVKHVEMTVDEDGIVLKVESCNDYENAGVDPLEN